ncbi:hypothetical protein EYV94_25075 [Puteibacter caeruleilacunae]|nr:hypothetical protein EYV94_25075 [Puteibacter caeruleilacunae]
MRYTIAIYIIILFCSSCQVEKRTRFEYLGNKLEDRITSEWTIISENKETRFKSLENRNDSNFVCRCVADTIWDMMIFNIDKKAKEVLKNKINKHLGVSYDSTYHPKSAHKFERFELKWSDNEYLDIIRLSKIKMNDKTGFGNWILEISNDSLLNRLDKNHNPYYDLPLSREKR